MELSSYFPPSGPAPWAPGSISSEGKIPSPELRWYWYCLNAKKYLGILKASNKNKNFKQFRKKFCYEP